MIDIIGGTDEPIQLNAMPTADEWYGYATGAPGAPGAAPAKNGASPPPKQSFFTQYKWPLIVGGGALALALILKRKR